MPSRIRCEAMTVRTDTGICPGMAKTRKGEIYEIGNRTPEPEGMCCQAFGALHAVRTAMAVTLKGSDVRDPFDITCPHGAVTFRLSRID
jgi:hypothetical protein